MICKLLLLSVPRILPPPLPLGVLSDVLLS